MVLAEHMKSSIRSGNVVTVTSDPTVTVQDRLSRSLPNVTLDVHGNGTVTCTNGLTYRISVQPDPDVFLPDVMPSPSYDSLVDEASRCGASKSVADLYARSTLQDYQRWCDEHLCGHRATYQVTVIAHHGSRIEGVTNASGLDLSVNDDVQRDVARFIVSNNLLVDATP